MVGKNRDEGRIVGNDDGSHVGRFGPTMMTEAAAVVAVVEASNYRKVSATVSEYE